MAIICKTGAYMAWPDLFAAAQVVLLFLRAKSFQSLEHLRPCFAPS